MSPYDEFIQRLSVIKKAAKHLQVCASMRDLTINSAAKKMNEIEQYTRSARLDFDYLRKTKGQ